MEKRGRASTFGGRSTNIFFHHLRNFIVKHDTIERPTLVRTRDFLSHGGEEASRVEESGHPEGGWSTFEQPRIKLLVAIEKVGEPETKSGRLPRNLKHTNKKRSNCVFTSHEKPSIYTAEVLGFITNLLPDVGDSGIVHVVKSVAQRLRHNNGSINREFEIFERRSDCLNDFLDSIDFLTQEDVEGSQVVHLSQPIFDLVREVVSRDFLQHVVCEAIDDRLARFSARTTRVFRLDAHNACQHRVRRVRRITTRKRSILYFSKHILRLLINRTRALT